MLMSTVVCWSLTAAGWLGGNLRTEREEVAGGLRSSSRHTSRARQTILLLLQRVLSVSVAAALRTATAGLTEAARCLILSGPDFNSYTLHSSPP